MNIPKHLLQSFHESIGNILNSYNREHVTENVRKRPKEDIESLVNQLYGSNKKIEWLNTNLEVSKNLSITNKPWVYHYSVNLSWVLFYKCLYELAFSKNINQKYVELDNFLEEGQETYNQVCNLYVILNAVDGIMESDDTIYLVKTDLSFIKQDVGKIFI